MYKLLLILVGLLGVLTKANSQVQLGAGSGSGSTQGAFVSWNVGVISVTQTNNSKGNGGIVKGPPKWVSGLKGKGGAIISPNPTKGLVHVYDKQSTNYKLLNVMGMVLEQGVFSKNLQLDLAKYPGSLYYLMLDNDTYKLLKQ